MYILQAQPHMQMSQQPDYTHMLLELDAAASSAVDLSLQDIQVMNEPQVARDVSQLLPQGRVYFLH